MCTAYKRGKQIKQTSFLCGTLNTPRRLPPAGPKNQNPFLSQKRHTTGLLFWTFQSYFRLGSLQIHFFAGDFQILAIKRKRLSANVHDSLHDVTSEHFCTAGAIS